jgi:hypothetical protein
LTPPTAAAAADGAEFSSNGVGPTVGTASQASPHPQAPAGASSAAQQNGTAAVAPEEEPTGLLARVKLFFTGSKLDKARLAALGFGAFSAYGVISNINAGKVTSSAQVPGSPLEPGGGHGQSFRLLAVPGEVVIAFLRPFERGALERNVPREWVRCGAGRRLPAAMCLTCARRNAVDGV